MGAVVAPVVDEEQCLGSDNRGQDCQYPEIPVLLGSRFCSVRVRRHSEAGDYPKGNQEAVCREEETADMK